MAKQIVPIQKPRTFWTQVHKNRIKIALSLFFILIPIVLVVIAYVGTYANQNKIHFDQSVTDETVFIKKFVDPDQIDALTLDISWYELKHPTTDTEGELVNGYYAFDIFYTEKDNYEVTTVNVTPVLKTPWTDLRSMGSLTTLYTSSRRVTIPFNYELPVKPLWFVTVTDPVLYLKVTYTFNSAGSQLEKTAYVKLVLEDLNPTRVATS